MATAFPAALDDFVNPAAADPPNSPSHSAQHANINDAVEALEAKVGIDGSTVATSLDFKVTDHLADASNPHSVTKAQVGLGSVDNTTDAGKPVSTAQAVAIAVVQADVDAHEARTDNPHSVTKSQVGLSNADNTSDANKPVSTAQQTAIDAKVSDVAYNATTWDGVTTVAPSKNAVRDFLTTLGTVAFTSSGDYDAAGSAAAAQAASQPLDADLTTWAGLSPSANAQSLVTAASYAAMRTLLDLEAGTDFYSVSAADTLLAAKASATHADEHLAAGIDPLNAVTAKSADFTADSDKNYLYYVDVTSGNVAATLPSGTAGNKGVSLKFVMGTQTLPNSLTVASNYVLFLANDCIELISVGTAGWYVTQLHLTPHVCILHETTHGTFTNPGTAISWDTEDSDNADLHSTSTNPTRITIKRAGQYNVTAAVRMASTVLAGADLIAVYKNGAEYAATEVWHVATGFKTRINIALVVDCAAGDYLEIFVTMNSGSAATEAAVLGIAEIL